MVPPGTAIRIEYLGVLIEEQMVSLLLLATKNKYVYMLYVALLLLRLGLEH